MNDELSGGAGYANGVKNTRTIIRFWASKGWVKKEERQNSDYVRIVPVMSPEKLKERFDRRIEELAQRDAYREKVNRLVCFKGIRTHTALSLIVEVGDFQRFPTAGQFASFLGLVPGEHSSGDSQHRGAITKAGNSHLRRLLVESGNCYNRVQVGRKSAALKQRQEGNPPDVIAYADKANDRLRRKYVRITTRSKANIAKTAVARELACFIWGMMNGKLTQD